MKAIDEERKLKAEIATLNRRIGQLRRHDNIWEGFRGAEIAKAEWERDNKGERDMTNDELKQAHELAKARGIPADEMYWLPDVLHELEDDQRAYVPGQRP